MKRRLACDWCERPLPAGCRLDKKYCDQRCVELAYYERHPEKRAQKLAKLRGARTDTGLRTRRPEATPELVERMEAAHASTRQEFGAVRERLSQMEALLRSQNRVSKDPSPPQNWIQEIVTTRKVEELQGSLQAEKKRADDAEREQGRLQAEIEGLSQQLRQRHRGEDASPKELTLTRDALGKANQRIRDLEAELRHAQTTPSRPASVVQDPKQTAALTSARASIADLANRLDAAVERANHAEQANEDAETQLEELRQTVEKWRAHAQTQASQLAEAQSALSAAEQRAAKAQRQSHEGSSARLPWTQPAPDNPHRYIPRWKAEGGGISNLDEITESALAEVPGQLWKNGDRKLSQEMREWLETPTQVLRRISRQIVLRIVCTPPAERRSEKQKEVLGEAALADSIQFLIRRKPDVAEELEAEVETERENYEFLAGELVIACSDMRLREYS